MDQSHMHLKAYISFRKRIFFTWCFDEAVREYHNHDQASAREIGREKNSKKDQRLINTAKSYRGRGSDRKVYENINS